MNSLCALRIKRQRPFFDYVLLHLCYLDCVSVLVCLSCTKNVLIHTSIDHRDHRAWNTAARQRYFGYVTNAL